MEYDIFESISQGEYGENATQNGRSHRLPLQKLRKQ